jgi:hypothetical protein
MTAMEAQLRELAVLATIVLLLVLTLQIMWLTSDRRPSRRDR